MANISENKNFVKSVENFVFKNDKRYSNEIALKKSMIPNVFKPSMVLYRGMILDVDFVDAIKDGYNGFTLKDISSWTMSEKMAERFVNDPSKRIKKTDGVGVIFKKKFTTNQIILNIQGFVMFLEMSGKLKKFNFDEDTKNDAFEEQEVLIDKGIKLNKNNILRTIKL